MPAAITLSQPVGENAENRPSDVLAVQRLLNLNLYRLPLVPRLAEDGVCGPLTIATIREFQRLVLDFSWPDGRVDPGGKTLATLNEPYINPALQKLLREEDYAAAAQDLAVDVATIQALAHVESNGSGFLENGNPKILFEGHWFHRFTGGQYDALYPTLSYAQWTKRHYLGGEREYERYEQAFSLDPEAAMKSTSWGKFQIMGFNYEDAGYSSVQGFVSDMKKTEGHHLQALVAFIKNNSMAELLRNKQWADFAKAYNGPGYADNQYDVKLEQAYRHYANSL
ncbi:N-acetylmuramidase family protein [Marinimicrobium locisalis]|uniref:N-acetylmuramidase family protein n=1 Tax=Marinimicrobium locisalis TaxID=546022 RepID=UPI00322198FD